MLARSVVAGRFVNAFCTSDWTLSLNFRARLVRFYLPNAWARCIAGLSCTNPPSAPSKYHSVNPFMVHDGVY